MKPYQVTANSIYNSLTKYDSTAYSPIDILLATFA